MIFENGIKYGEKYESTFTLKTEFLKQYKNKYVNKDTLVMRQVSFSR